MFEDAWGRSSVENIPIFQMVVRLLVMKNPKSS